MIEKRNSYDGTFNVAFRSGELDLQLRGRGGEGATMNAVAKRDLVRWYSLLASAMREVRLTRDELALAVEVLEDRPEPSRRADAGWWKAILISRLTPKAYNGDELARSLLAKLDGFSHALVWALVDAAERHYQWPGDWPIDALAAESEL